MTRSRPVQERLWARIAKAGPDDCWEWMGGRIPGGYGQIGLGSRSDGKAGTHRLAWESVNGPIPAGMVVRHSCDNPPCCNPAHLSVGTQADNVQDARERDRMAREFRMPQTRLSDADVIAIRVSYWRLGSRSNSQELADRFGVTPNYIRKIGRGAGRGVAA